jgi:hypothetical protein
MGRRLDDEVSVRRPKGETVYTILSIDYTHETHETQETQDDQAPEAESQPGDSDGREKS